MRNMLFLADLLNVTTPDGFQAIALTVLFSFLASSELKELLAKALKGSVRLIKVVIKDGG